MLNKLIMYLSLRLQQERCCYYNWSKIQIESQIKFYILWPMINLTFFPLLSLVSSIYQCLLLLMNKIFCITIIKSFRRICLGLYECDLPVQSSPCYCSLHKNHARIHEYYWFPYQLFIFWNLGSLFLVSSSTFQRASPFLYTINVKQFNASLFTLHASSSSKSPKQ